MEASGLFSGAAVPKHLQQMFAGGDEVDQGAGGKKPVEVLGQPAIAHLREAELEFDQREDMLDPRAGFALDAVLFAHLRVGLELGPPAPVDTILCRDRAEVAGSIRV